MNSAARFFPYALLVCSLALAGPNANRSQSKKKAALDPCAQKLAFLAEILKQTKWAKREHRTLTNDASGHIAMDGVRVRVFSAPQNHDKGELHEVIYEVSRGAEQHLVKVMDTRPGERFDAEINGMKLGEQFGGPKVFSAGTLHLPNGRIQHFVEMERLFPDDKHTYTWKGFLNSEGAMTIPEPEAFADLARLFLEAYSHRSCPHPSEVDFIVSGQKARWIDTGGFRFYRKKKFDAEFVSSLDEVANELSYSSHKAEREFVKAFFKGLMKNRELTSLEKREILLLSKYFSFYAGANKILREMLPKKSKVPKDATNWDIIDTLERHFANGESP